jgi:hypothetical protein
MAVAVSEQTELRSSPARCSASARRRSNLLKGADYALAFLLLLCAGAVYVRTLRPSFGWLDSSELATAAYHLGIGHNPGYPTFILIAHLFTYLPVGSVAYRLNLMTAFFGALSVGLLFLLLRRLRLGRLACFLASACFAFSYTLWDLTTECEVYTLHAVFMLGAVLLWLEWRETRSDKWLRALALLLGVSAGNHALTLLLALGLAAAVLAEAGRALISFKRLAPIILFGLAGLSVYAYVPLRAFANPPPAVNNPHSLKGFWELLTAPGCRQLMFVFPVQSALVRAVNFIVHLKGEFGPIACAVGILGLAAALRTDRTFLAGLMAIAFLHIFYAANYDIFDIYTYLLPVHIIWAIFIGLGFSVALGFLQRLKPSLLGAAAIGFLAFCPVWPLAYHFQSVDGSKDTEAADFARAAVQIAEPGSIIIGDWYSIAPIGYLRYVEGQRADLTLSVAFSSFSAQAMNRTLDRRYLERFPAVYGLSPQTGWVFRLRKRYATEAVGPLIRAHVNGLQPRFHPAASDHSGPAPNLAGARFPGVTLRLVEFPTAVAGGDLLKIAHTWEKTGSPPTGTLEALFVLQSKSKDVVERARCLLVEGVPANEWPSGQTWTGAAYMLVPADVAPGAYQLSLRVRPVGGAPSSGCPGWIPLGRIRILPPSPHAPTFGPRFISVPTEPLPEGS